MNFDEFIDSIVIVVVLYKTKLNDCETINSILVSIECKPHFFIYDNSPEYNINLLLGDCYVADPKNSGVSRAYNLGAEYAKLKHKKWLLLCDQDTKFNSGYFVNLFELLSKEHIDLVAPYLYSNGVLISPCRFKFNYGSALKVQPHSGICSLKGISLLNSGIFISLMAFEKCGGYNEKVFLDFSDFDFMKKYRNIFSSFYLMDFSLQHELESSMSNYFNEQRFILYLKSYFGSIQNGYDFFTILMIIFFRTIKISFRFGSFKPIMLLLKCFKFDIFDNETKN